MSQREQESMKFVSFDHDGVLDAFLEGNKKKNDIFVRFVENAVGIYVGTAKQTRRREIFTSLMWEGTQTAYATYTGFLASLSKMKASKPPRFYPILLEDAHRGLRPGTTFKETKAAIEEAVKADVHQQLHEAEQGKEKLPQFLSKIDILLLQMQDAAQKSSGQPARFHFADDSSPIISKLYAFYLAHRDLMPNNITLHLHRVTHGRDSEVACEDFEPIVGTGAILSPKRSAEALRVALNVAAQGVKRPDALGPALSHGNPTPEELAQQVRFVTSLREYHAVNAQAIEAFSQSGPVPLCFGEHEVVHVASFARSIKHTEWLLNPKTKIGLMAGTATGFAVFAAAVAVTAVVLVNGFAAAGITATLGSVLAAHPAVIGAVIFVLLGAIAGAVTATYFGKAERVSSQCLIGSSEEKEDPKAESSVEHK